MHLLLYLKIAFNITAIFLQKVVLKSTPLQFPPC